ncbi:MAG: HlyC/CorC family transporter [Chitinophagaceae bacterium]|nr:HlyC/CorC family transporter [Chitinophagaceae bacterium]MCA6454425.1 HlyC/CorC family transporter [Chitinophagaceae bacterium]MCA6455113.1 HlyC/CorC family transporter [Chitinophagaceae bacterium]MCA6458807.1 HlyC/CorC family transporter [Chitinophagaceae bacterium]MCA6464315.1 HlyC/CorC family transporter [Chitinophagaceae bacterium]
MTELYTLIWIGVTLILIGFFAGYEIAFVSANRLSIELKKKQGKKSGIILSNFMEHPARFIGTCLIGLNIFLVIYGLLVHELMSKTIWTALWTSLKFQNEYVKLGFDTLMSSLVVLVFGEFIPKAIFRAKADSLLSFFARIANFFHTLFLPLTNFFVDVSQWILKYMFNVRVKDKEDAFTKVDLEHFFQQSKEQDEDSQELNTELFENALSLPMVKIRQCLVPRTEIEAIDINTSIEEAKRTFISTQLSKLVVYDENIDNILGYIHQLDLFRKPDSIRSVLHPIMAVPESMSATDLIGKFTKERKSIAWVVDEFGGTAGIVTMEDLLEEIFGEIQDEYDVEELVEKQLAEDEFIFSGRMELDYLNEKYDMKFPSGESETLSGYIINEHETIPKQKETIIIDDYRFDILNVSDTRIESVKMKILR